MRDRRAGGGKIFSYTGGSATNSGGIVAGNTFTAFGGQTFNSLGFIDIGSDGIAGSYQLRQWDTSSQALLASTTVTPSSRLINGFRYSSVPATTIPNGAQFTIGALLPVGPIAEAWMVNTGLALGPGFGGAGTGQFVGSPTLAFPTSNDAAPVRRRQREHDRRARSQGRSA